MIAFSTLLSSVLMFALLIIPGFLLGKCKKIDHDSLESMTNILMYVAMPFLVFVKLLRTDLQSISYTDILLCAIFPAFAIFFVFFLSSLCFREKGKTNRYRAGRFCSVFSNCGFLGIPLAEVLFPDRPEVAVYVSLFNVVNTFLLLTFGVYVLSGDRRDISVRRAVLSPIMASILLGVICSVLGVADFIPQVVTYADILAALTTPLSMIVLGVQLSGLPIRTLVTTPTLYLTALFKLVIAPLSTVLMLLVLQLCGFPLSTPLMAGIFIATAVSSAASASAMAKKYGVDGEYAAILTLGTTILCAVSLPLLYMLSAVILGW
jgi:predicted permease